MTTTRLRAERQVVVGTARSADRRLLVAAAGTALTLAAVLHWLPAEQQGPLAATVALLLAVAVPWALDDDAGQALAVVPTSPRHRLGLRVGLGLLPSAVLWWAAASLFAVLTPGFDVEALTLGWARAALVALTCALIVHRWRPDLSAPAVGAVAVLALELVSLIATAPTLPPLFLGWAGVTALALAAALAFGWASHEPR